MAQTADVVIIGAGIQGTSLAYHLSLRGVQVTVIERRVVAAAATGRSSGLVRLSYDRADESLLAWTSFRYFRDWAETVGGDCGFVRTGFLRLVPRRAAAALRAAVEMQQGLGIPTLLVTPDDVRRLAPAFVTDDFDVAAYEPDSGYADPTSSAASLMRAARDRGAVLVQECDVTAVQTSDSRVTGVVTTQGTYAAPVVVDAAGAWAGMVGRFAGLELPIQVWRHDTAFIRRPSALGTTHPTVIDDGNEMYFRPEGRELTLVGLEDDNRIGGEPGDDDEVAPRFMDRVVDRICRRIPEMADGELHSMHSGLDGLTPDQRPIIGPAGPEGFWVDCGFSGTGFKTGPAVGRSLAEWILDGHPSTVDITAFELRRFAEGRLLHDEHAFGTMWR